MPNNIINMDDILAPKGVDLSHFVSITEKLKQDIASGKIKLRKVNMSIYGTEQLMDVMIFLAKLATTSKQAIDDDGKITIGDAAKFVGLIFPLVNAITQIQEVPKELTDLDPIEKNELMLAIKENLEIAENDELAVESALKVVFELFNFLTIVGVIQPPTA